MQLRTFTAPSMPEALKLVKLELGLDAVILHTRTYHRRRWLGLRREPIVEITAGAGMAHHKRSCAVNPGVKRPERREEPVTLAKLPAKGSEAPKQFLQTAAASNAVMLGLSQDIQNLKSMIGDLVRQNRSQQAPSIPEDLFDYYTQLIQNQVAEELAADVVKTLQLNLRPEHCKNAAFVKEKIAEQIEKILPTSGPIHRTKTSGPHVVALIGPTGVGKTTTIAKLAANLKLRENHRVGLITIDTYRIAAVDQLRKYADIIGSPLEVVTTPEDLRAAIDRMSQCEFVLIDTAGRSPTDTLKLNELKNFIAVARPDEVHLVLSTTASQACIESAIARFADVRVDKIILTKLDEAVHVGTVLNVVKKVNKALSYITTGQDVPDDIEVGAGRKLARMILGEK